MDKELETYYTNYFTLFNTDGWKQLLGELHSQALQVNSVELAKDSNDLHFRKGQLTVIATLLNFEETIKNAFEDLENDAKGI